GNEIVEAQQRLIRPLALAEDAQQLRRQLRQTLTRLDGLRGAVAAIVPGTDGAGNIGGTLEAETLQRLERIRIVLLPREDEIACLGGKLRLLLEERRITPLDGLQHFDEPCRESRGVLKTHHEGDTLQFAF